MSSGSEVTQGEVPISADADAAVLSLQRSRAFWESSLRRKKPASWKVQEMKVLLEMFGLDT